MPVDLRTGRVTTDKSPISRRGRFGLSERNGPAYRVTTNTVNRNKNTVYGVCHNDARLCGLPGR
jgi:hypothetical protein